MKGLSLANVHCLIEPGPTVLVTTSHNGRSNIMALSWHMMIGSEPPLIGCVIGPWNHTFTALRDTGECVLAIPTVDLADQVIGIGHCSGGEIDKFSVFDLTPLPAKRVKSPLIAECLANLECRVESTRLMNQYSLFILKVVKAWIDRERKERRTIHHNGDGSFIVDGKTINLAMKMTKWREHRKTPSENK